MKKFLTVLTAAAISLSSCLPALAGQWQQDETGWWYDNGDSTYASNGWQWIDGRCYYFTPEGYCLTGTVTPDGYTVDESGAWTVNGVVQTQEGSSSQAQTGQSEEGIAFFVPQGFVVTVQEEDAMALSSADGSKTISVVRQELGGESFQIFQAMGMEDTIDQMIDSAMASLGQYKTKAEEQLNSGSWQRYDYEDASLLGLSGTLTAYARVEGSCLEIVMFAGAYSGTEVHDLMNSCAG
ncbi:MAG TPA: hypothetical protein IAA51_14335 [Candidatus Cottocaccamicrobium excrementipullorum]|nr:hypothetical protein [Candidatus Cottocaccamicrobium excrementipullorum]